jgi:hypothetical protein
MKFVSARKIADAVLYEGYILYPYRPSAVKNQFRWQFGVIAPQTWSQGGGCEPWEMQTECLVQPKDQTLVDIVVRFLQVRPRSDEPCTWEEGIEHSIDLKPFSPDATTASGFSTSFEIAGESYPITGSIRVTSNPVDGFIKLRVRIENHTGLDPGVDRTCALRHSLVGTHTLLSVTGGEFISLTDPPQEAKNAASSCSNLHTWPVLVGRPGERNVILSLPIILEDYPSVAAVSPGNFFDAT